MVVLQLASAQYSPRVLRSFIRDHLVQTVLAAYIATFVYCLRLLPTIGSNGDGEEEVPALAVTVALALALASLGLFVRYVHHIAHAIRAVTIINNLAVETRDALEEMYPETIVDEADRRVEQPTGPTTAIVTWDGEPGVLLAVDEGALLEAATEAGAVVELCRMAGEFVPSGSEVFHVWGEIAERAALTECISLGAERTMHQDAAYGFRQIVDIAERALSPAVNSPPLPSRRWISCTTCSAGWPSGTSRRTYAWTSRGSSGSSPPASRGTTTSGWPSTRYAITAGGPSRSPAA